MEYWIIVNEERVGPLTIEALKEYDLKADTPVWYVGLEDWIQANQVAELAELLNNEVTETDENFNTEATEIVETESVPESEQEQPVMAVEKKLFDHVLHLISYGQYWLLCYAVLLLVYQP